LKLQQIYNSEKEKYQSLYQVESHKLLVSSTLRLVLAAICLYTAFQYFFKDAIGLYGIIAAISLIVFLLLVKRHERLNQQTRLYEQLVRINETEIKVTNGDYSDFYDGNEFEQPDHPYTFDLDGFGKKSLYQYLNRTANFIGRERLSQYLISPEKTEIERTQAATQELSPLLTWRQEFLAMGQLDPDNQNAYRQLLLWAKQAPVKTSMIAKAFYWLLTALTLGLVVLACISAFPWVGGMLKFLTLFNLFVVALHTQQIKQEISQLNAIHKTVAQYGNLIQSIEKQAFKSEKLREIQQGLKPEKELASAAILQLSVLLNRLESVQNIFATILFNSLGLYHLHTLIALQDWKKEHAASLENWINSVGEMEALNSLGHFVHNHPTFVFPTLSKKVEMEMIDLGHPLIAAEKRINNDISFKKEGFVILTGSNMSGKSTFLRTLGINLLLVNAGLPVCAKRCTTYPFDIFVCMKLSDSLHDNESYFYAELKRLQRIVTTLQNGKPCFVLLDEVLRGTNSNDKLAGTLGLTERMIDQKATGIIATHDLKVCDLTTQYPDYLRNMCFEVEMTTDNLIFDYKLREGVCVNKSASFLMKKMGITGA
jgi:ABC-type multidrug transport system fused ATPase/permease subunit